MNIAMLLHRERYKDKPVILKEKNLATLLGKIDQMDDEYFILFMIDTDLFTYELRKLLDWPIGSNNTFVDRDRAILHITQYGLNRADAHDNHTIYKEDRELAKGLAYLMMVRESIFEDLFQLAEEGWIPETSNTVLAKN